MRNAQLPAHQISRLLVSQGRDVNWLSQQASIDMESLHGILDGRTTLSLEDAAVIASTLNVDLTFLTHGNDEAAVGIPQIASMLGVSSDTVYRMARDGDLPGFKLKGVWRFFPSEVKDHVRNQSQKTDPWAQSARSRSRRRVA